MQLTPNHDRSHDADSTLTTMPGWNPRDLSPGYFAFVMGSSIVSISLYLCGYVVASTALLVIAAIAYVLLVGLNLWRLIAHRSAMSADLRDTRQSFGFFTFVAGTGVLGSRLAMSGWWATAVTLLAIAAVSWLILGYFLPVYAVLGTAERPLVKAANGTWFIWVVGVQSVAVLAAILQPNFTEAGDILATTAVFAWALGFILYGTVAVVVVLRLLIYQLDPREFKPPYWVFMGALAITVVAAARITEMAPSPIVDSTWELIAGIAILLWCFATWMLPVLIGVGVWRHGFHKVPLIYESSLWSIVFPLGMYSVASISLGRGHDLAVIEAVGTAWLWVAVIAWIITFIAMLWTILRRIIHRN